MLKLSVLMFLLAVLTPSAQAEEPPTADADAIRTQQANIRQAVLERNPRFLHLDGVEQTELFAHQDRVSALLAGITQTQTLPERRRIQLFNALESISALVNDDPGSRLECWRERPVGQMQAETRCSTERGLRAQHLTYQRVWNRAGQR